jgi:hypothetical protein
MSKKYIIQIITLLSLCGHAKAQLFRLDSLLYQKFNADSLSKYIIKNENAKGRLPIFASQDMVTLFHLRDTLIDGMHINYFTSATDMVKKYGLRKTGTSMDKISLKFVKSGLGKVSIDMTYSYFKCDEYMIKGKILGEINDVYLIEFNPLNTVKPITITYNGEH